MDVILACDIGGTNSRISMQTLNGEELNRVVVPTIGDDYPAARKQIFKQATALLEGHRLISAGLAIAGCVDNCGALTGSGNLPDWKGHNLKDDFGQLFGTTNVVVLNDCAAAALGEYSALQKPLIYVIWGTGVGVATATAINEHVHGRPTELGHMVIDRHSKLTCGCGGVGHLEALVGGANMPQRFEGSEGKDLTIFNWLEVFEDLAVGLRNLSMGDLDLPIVLGGGVTDKQLGSKPHRLLLLQEMVDATVSTCLSPRLKLAVHGEDSGLIGTSFAARQLMTV